MTTCRAKFVVHQVLHSIFQGEINCVIVKARPVYSDSKENEIFWKATSSGSLEMQINNPNAFEFFQTGKEYYLDFIPVEN